MIDENKVVALVPLRGGSKSIPRKNIKPIAGKPLCEWILRALLANDEIDEVYVSTDDAEICETVSSIDPDIGIIKRPAELATDEASTESVMIHFAENVDFDVLITAQATSPLTTSQDIHQGLNSFFGGNYDSLLTGVREKRFYWNKKRGKATPINYDYGNRPRRQEFEGWIMENGAFYITKRAILIKEKCRLGGNIGILEMDPKTGMEIDEPYQWQLVEALLLLQRRILPKWNSNIDLLVVDVDGTLTDAGMYYSEKGEQLKKFNTRDAKGLELVRREGIMVCIMSSEDSDIVKSRAQKLQLESVFLGISDKLQTLKRLCERRGLDLANVAFIGDDINDLECIKNVGLSGCPSDAQKEVRRNAGYICKNGGGKGAVREFCELLMAQAKRTTQTDEN